MMTTTSSVLRLCDTKMSFPRTQTDADTHSFSKYEENSNLKFSRRSCSQSTLFTKNLLKQQRKKLFIRASNLKSSKVQ